MANIDPAGGVNHVATPAQSLNIKAWLQQLSNKQKTLAIALGEFAAGEPIANSELLEVLEGEINSAELQELLTPFIEKGLVEKTDNMSAGTQYINTHELEQTVEEVLLS